MVLPHCANESDNKRCHIPGRARRVQRFQRWAHARSAITWPAWAAVARERWLPTVRSMAHRHVGAHVSCACQRRAAKRGCNPDSRTNANPLAEAVSTYLVLAFRPGCGRPLIDRGIACMSRQLESALRSR
ncbi:hypothetical protein xavtCFBP7764_11715 [Xanthomonas citri]|nr:hypothetical protein xavtCFBP7764_11715 [Xanthomonas citri]